MAKGRQQRAEPSDEDSYDYSEMSEEQGDISEIWSDFVSKLEGKEADQISVALVDLAGYFDQAASNPEMAKSNAEDIKKIFEEREKLANYILTNEESEIAVSIFEVLSLILVSARHTGLYATREEYASLIKYFQKKLKEAPIKTKKEEMESSDEADEEEDSEEDSSEDFSMQDTDWNPDTLSLMLYAARGDDIAWLYNEHLRTKLAEDGWDEVTMNIFRSFFKVLSQCDYEEPDCEYKVSLILEDMIKLMEHISSNNDIPENLIYTGLDVVEDFISSFINILKEEDLKKILDEFLKLMQSATVIANDEGKAKLANIACCIGDSCCVCGISYKKEIFGILTRFFTEITSPYSSSSLDLFLQISDALFSLLEKSNVEGLKTASQVLEKCLDVVDEIQASSKSAKKGKVIESINNVLNTIAIGIKVIPYSEEIATKFVNTLKIDNIRYPRRVTQKTLETLLHEMCGGFLANIESKATKFYFSTNGMEMPVTIAKALITLIEQISPSNTSFKGVEGDAGTGVSFKGIINYSKHLSEASHLLNDDISSAALELASVAINKSDVDVWKGACDLKAEWTNVRRMLEITYEGNSGCHCGCEDSCCGDCDCEREEDESVTILAVKHLIKAAVKKQIATASQMDMMIVKMRVPKLKGFDSFEKVERSLIIFVYFYLECLRNDIDIDANFFKTNVLFFIDKFIKEYGSDYKQAFNQLKKEFHVTADKLMEIDDVRMILASINLGVEDLALSSFNFLERMCKILKVVPESRKKQLEADIASLDASTKRLLESSVANHNGIATMIPCIVCCEDIPEATLSVKYILEHAPKSVSELDSDKCSANKPDISDFIEYLGAVIESCSSCGDDNMVLFQDLLKKYHNVLVYDPNVQESICAQRFTHFPLLMASLRKGENNTELWEATISEMRSIRSADAMLYVADKIGKLSDAQKEVVRGLKSKEQLKEILKLVEGVATGATGKKNNEMLNNVKKLLEFLA